MTLSHATGKDNNSGAGGSAALIISLSAHFAFTVHRTFDGSFVKLKPGTGL